MKLKDLPESLRKLFETRTHTDENGEEREVFIASRAAKPAISNLSITEKRERAIALGVPAPGSGLPGEWDDSMAKRVIQVPLTDETPDRHGTVILREGMDLGPFEKNPVYRLNHKTGIPIGLVLKVVNANIVGTDGRTRKGRNAHVLIHRADANPESEVYYRAYVSGLMRATSIGFVFKSWRKAKAKELEKWGLEDDHRAPWVIDGSELIELSGVDVPSNPSMVQRSLASAVESGLFSGAELEPMFKSVLKDAPDDLMEALRALPEATAEMTEDEVLEAARNINPDLAWDDGDGVSENVFDAIRKAIARDAADGIDKKLTADAAGEGDPGDGDDGQRGNEPEPNEEPAGHFRFSDFHEFEGDVYLRIGPAENEEPIEQALAARLELLGFSRAGSGCPEWATELQEQLSQIRADLGKEIKSLQAEVVALSDQVTSAERGGDYGARLIDGEPNSGLVRRLETLMEKLSDKSS